MKNLKYKQNGEWESLYKVYKEVKISKDKSKAVAGDIVMWDGEEKYVLIDTEDETLQYVKDLGHTPIGVVVIPTSHDVYGTGECAIISLKAMSYSTPDKGGNSLINWGNNGYEIAALKNFNTVNTVDTSGILIGTSDYSYIPSTKFTSNISVDGVAGYYSTSYMGPSPYLVDGSRNPVYSSTEKSEFNALSDFDGVGNSRILWDKATKQTDWKTSKTITNNTTNGYLPAACCCWRYHTIGTEQGDWYLPAAGELGYMIARFKEIQSAFTKIGTIYDTDFVSLLNPSDNYWSSTQHSGSKARSVGTSGCSASQGSRDSGYNVKAFSRI